MANQSYSSHRQWVPAYHFVLTLLILATLVGSVINLMSAPPEGVYSASLITAMSVALFMTALFARIFALKAQDRAIRAEENFRHFALTGNQLDARITMRQAIGLRFASDGELASLAERAASEGLSEDKIKESITSWRSDLDRL
jgi:uncharacterized protein DUF6526